MRSKFERSVAEQLTALGIRWEYESHTLEFLQPVKNGWCTACEQHGTAHSANRYTPDFWLPDYGVYIEVKGMMDSKYRTRIEALLAHMPNLKLHWLIQNDNPLVANRKAGTRKRKAKRYSDWIRQNGMSYSVKTLPLTRELFEAELNRRDYNA